MAHNIKYRVRNLVAELKLKSYTNLYKSNYVTLRDTEKNV